MRWLFQSISLFSRQLRLSCHPERSAVLSKDLRLLFAHFLTLLAVRPARRVAFPSAVASPIPASSNPRQPAPAPSPESSHYPTGVLRRPTLFHTWQYLLSSARAPRPHRQCVRRDRKSTRLNSSHLGISYAV